MPPSCSTCGRTFVSYSMLVACAKCNAEVYCDEDCAKGDLKNHKTVCTALSNLSNTVKSKISIFEIDKSISTISFKMLDDDESVLRGMTLGGYKPLLKSLEAAMTSGPMTQSNLHLIANLCLDCPSLRVPITLEGGSLFVIKALKAYMNHPNSILREAACHCLELLANNPNTKMALIEQGAADCMLECMITHPDDQYIQASGTSMILSLSSTRKHRKLLADLGALPVIVRANYTHAHSSLSKTISEFAKLLFRRFQSDGEFNELLQGIGALDLIDVR